MMNNRIIIFGSEGCLAKHIIEKLISEKYNIKKISRKTFDYVNGNNKILEIIKKFKPRIIINCSAMSELGKCESNPKKAYEINSLFPYRLSLFSKLMNSTLIHFSSDAVFDGKKKSIYSIKDKALPNTVYGQTKLAGEKLVSYYKKSIIIRLPLLYGKYHKKQIIGALTKKLKNGKKIFASQDVYSTPVNSDDIAAFIKKNLKKNTINKLIKKKIIHISNDKKISIFNFMKKISFILNKSKNVIPVNDNFFKKNYDKPKNLGLKRNINNFKYSNLYNFVYEIK